MDALFSPLFPIPHPSAWLSQVRKELNDENAYESLRWHTDEGFVMEPYYTDESLADLPLATSQEAQKAHPGWLNTPAYAVANVKEANASLRSWLAQGADAFVLQLRQQPDLSALLYGIKLSETPVFFHIQSESSAFDTVRFIRDLKSIAPYQLRGGLIHTPDESVADVIRLTLDSPQFRPLCVDSRIFHNAGATATQQLAYTLASLTDLYDTLTDAGFTIDQLVSKTMVSVSVGTSYFLEIAKLRALRVLFQRFTEYYSVETVPNSLSVHAQTSTFYNAAVTPYTNLLRATTEAMAAVIGGCDALTVHPYDTALGNVATANHEFAERIARNVSLLLKVESYLDKVVDPSAGSYYIEMLTRQLTESAWALFLAIEERGGFQKALADGSIQAEVERAYHTKIEAVRQGKVLVGVTKFRTEDPINSTAPEKNLPIASGFNGSFPDRRLAGEFE